MVKLGASTSAIDALQGQSLQGKVAIVTGGNSGIGVETVRALATAGAKVYLCSRSVQQGQAVADDIKKDAAVKGDIVVKQLDLADLHNVQSFVDSYTDRVDLLILNAGIMACPLTYTKQGFESQFGVNHLGHFLLTKGLLPRMEQQGTPARIVSLSSMGHYLYKAGWDLTDLNWERRKNKYDSFLAYGQAKMANVVFAKEVAKRYSGTNIKAYSVHPGVIATNLMKHMPKWQQWLLTTLLLPLMGKNVSQGAATSVWAATAPELEGASGAYLADCKIAKNDPIADDQEAWRKLWELSEEMIAKAMAPEK